MNFAFKDDSLYYREILKARKPKYLISFGKQPRFDHLEGCVTTLIKKTKLVFMQQEIFLEGVIIIMFIYNLDREKLPEC